MLYKLVLVTYPLDHFLKPFLKGKILRSSERGVNSILTTILRFWPTSWTDRIFCLVASDSARREDHFQKKICPKRTFPSNFVKLVSKILYLFLAEKMVVCCLLLFVVVCCCLLLFVVVCCCLLLFVVVCCCLLLFVVVCCCLLLFVVVCCCLLLFVVVCCCLLLFVVVCCCLLLFVVVCCNFVRFWLTFFFNWSFRQAEKDAFKEKIIPCTVWELLNP